MLVIEYLQKNHIAKSEEFIDVLGVKISRVKTILAQMVAENLIVAEGENRNRHYKLNK